MTNQSSTVPASPAAPCLEDVGIWTEQQAADFLGKTVNTLRHDASRRRGPPRIKNGKQVLYRAKAVLEWLEVQEVDPDKRGARAA